MAVAAPDEVEYGEVFTRRWVVEAILDLVGYTSDRDLARMRLVEPSIGSGAFFVPIVERLLDSAKSHSVAVSDLGPALFGLDLQREHVETIGSAVDLWTAYREGAFGDQPQPFLGWIMLVEDCDKSRAPVRVKDPHFDVFDENRGGSYLERYEVLCRKLVSERLYSEAALIASDRVNGMRGGFSSLSEATSIRRFAASFAAHVAAEAVMTR